MEAPRSGAVFTTSAAGSGAARIETTINHCVIMPCPFRAADMFYSVAQGDGASAFALGCYAPAFHAGRAR